MSSALLYSRSNLHISKIVVDRLVSGSDLSGGDQRRVSAVAVKGFEIDAKRVLRIRRLPEIMRFSRSAQPEALLPEVVVLFDPLQQQSMVRCVAALFELRIDESSGFELVPEQKRGGVNAQQTNRARASNWRTKPLQGLIGHPRCVFLVAVVISDPR